MTFKPLDPPRSYYVDTNSKFIDKDPIDYKAAYELRRIDCMRLAKLNMTLIDALSRYVPEEFKKELEEVKTKIGNTILEM